MKILLVFILIVIVVLAIVFTSFQKVSKKNNLQNESSVPNNGEPKKNIFNDLRNRAFNMTPSQLGLGLVSANDVYAVIMDWDLKHGIMTLVSYQTGDASIYLSGGGGYIGGGQQENVKKAAKIFVHNAQSFISKAVLNNLHPLPDKNCVRFYLMTTAGVFTSQVEMKHIEDNSSEWLPLFIDANNVISEYRKVTENKITH